MARSEVFLETKVWVSNYGYDETLHAFEESSRKLGDNQIDRDRRGGPEPDAIVGGVRLRETASASWPRQLASTRRLTVHQRGN